MLRLTRKPGHNTAFARNRWRKRGTEIGEYLSQKEKLWEDLQEKDGTTQLSEDLMAYFLLDGSGLTEDQKRSIVMNSGSEYKLEKFQHMLRVNFHDIHEKEKRTAPTPQQNKYGGHNKWNKGHRGKANATEDHEDSEISDEDFDEEEQANAADDQDEIGSDAGASNDDEVFEAYSTYEAARKKLKDTQKQRGFFKGEVTFEERQEAIKEEKKRTRCGACGRIGHWAGDKGCPKSGQQGAKKFGDKSGGKGGFKPKPKPTTPGKTKHAFFTLDVESEDYEMGDAYAGAYAVNGESVQCGRAEDSDDSFHQDSDDDRAPGHYPVDEREDDGYHNRDYDEDRKKSQGPAAAAATAKPTPKAKPKIKPTKATEDEELFPTEDFTEWKVYELKKRLNELNLQVSGKREILIERLMGYYAGISQVQKGCSTARTAGATCSGTSVGMRGENIKCADCGKYGHHGGDASCPLYADMKAYRQVQERREQIKQELDSKTIPKPKLKASSKSSAASSASATWEFIDKSKSGSSSRTFRD